MAQDEETVRGRPAAPTGAGGAFAGDVLKLAGGTTVAQAITLLTAPILSRLFAPAAFGTLNVFTSMVGIVSVIVCLRYEQAIMLPKDDEEAVNVLAVSAAMAFIVSGIAAAVVLVAGEPIVTLLRVPKLAPFLWLVPLALLIQGAFQVVNFWNSRMRRFGRLSIARISASATTSAVPMALAALRQTGPGALIASWIGGTAVFAGTLAGQVWGDLRRFLGAIRLRRMMESMKRYRKFPLIDSWGILINTLSWQLPALMLSAFFSQETVGYYGQTSRIILLPLTLVGSAIAQVFFQRASELRHRPDELSRTTQMVFRRLVALGLFPAIMLTMAGRELFVVVFGSNWAEAGLYAQVLGLWIFFLVISSPLSNLFAVLERQELTLLVHCAILLTRVTALAVGGVLQNIYVALGIWTGTGVVVYGGLAIWNMRLAGVPLREAGRILWQYGLFLFPAMLIMLPVKLWLADLLWPVPLAMVLLLAGYYVLMLRRDPALYRYLLAIVGWRKNGQKPAATP